MRLLTAAALMGPVVMWSLGAFATPSITVGACDSTVVGSCPPPNVPITPTTSGVIASGFPSVAFSGVTFEKFDITGSGAAGTTSAGAFFDTQAISVSSTTGGVIDIYFSVNDITRPGSGPVLFTSSFTSNTQQGTSHSVDFSTWYDPANGLFSAADNLAAATINSANPKTEGPFLTWSRVVACLTSAPPRRCWSCIRSACQVVVRHPIQNV